MISCLQTLLSTIVNLRHFKMQGDYGFIDVWCHEHRVELKECTSFRTEEENGDGSGSGVACGRMCCPACLRGNGHDCDDNPYEDC